MSLFIHRISRNFYNFFSLENPPQLLNNNFAVGNVEAEKETGLLTEGVFLGENSKEGKERSRRSS